MWVLLLSWLWMVFKIGVLKFFSRLCRCVMKVVGLMWLLIGCGLVMKRYILFFDIGLMLGLICGFIYMVQVVIFVGCGRMVCYMVWLLQCGLGVWGKRWVCNLEQRLLVLIIRLQWWVWLLVKLILILLLILCSVVNVQFRCMLVFEVWVVLVRMCVSIGCKMVLLLGIFGVVRCGVGSLVICGLCGRYRCILLLVVFLCRKVLSILSCLSVCSVVGLRLMLVLQLCYWGLSFIRLIWVLWWCRLMVVDVLEKLLLMMRMCWVVSVMVFFEFFF